MVYSNILKTISWKEFFLEDVVTIENGKRLTKADMQFGITPFIGASEMNNGITAFTSSINESSDSNVLGVNYNGSVGFSFYHPYKAMFSDDVKRVKWREKQRNNKYTLLFLSVMIKQQKIKYAYGYKFNSKRMQRQKILLPMNQNDSVDWDFMEAYMKEMELNILKPTLEKLRKQVISNDLVQWGGRSSRAWKEFNFVDIFIIKKGFYNKKPPFHSDGNIPFVGASYANNGITGFSTIETINANSKVGYGKNEPLKKKLFLPNAICVTNNGSVGFAYYQTHEFTCSHDVNPLYLKGRELNRHIAVFLIRCIEQQRICFAYARKWRPKRMVKSKILLPVTNEGMPDWDYMEAFTMEIESKILASVINYYQKHI